MHRIIRLLTCARPEKKLEDWARWNRVGALFNLCFGLLFVLVCAIVLRPSAPVYLIGFAQIGIGAFGIFSSGSLQPKIAKIYFFGVIGLLAVYFVNYIFLFATFSAESSLSIIVCNSTVVGNGTRAFMPYAGDAEMARVLAASQRLCVHSASVVLGLLITVFILSISVCWFPCFRCAFHLKDAVEENRSTLLASEGYEFEGDDQLVSDDIFSIGNDL